MCESQVPPRAIEALAAWWSAVCSRTVRREPSVGVGAARAPTPARTTHATVTETIDTNELRRTPRRYDPARRGSNPPSGEDAVASGGLRLVPEHGRRPVSVPPNGELDPHGPEDVKALHARDRRAVHLRRDPA